MTLGIDTGSGLIPVHEWGSADSGAPGMLLLQEIFGVSGYIKQRAADLHALGYYVIAPEIYWRLDDTELDESAPDLLQRATGIVGRLDRDQAVTDLLDLQPQAPSLHHFGDADTFLEFHHADASALAWRRTEDFLARNLPTSQGQA